MFSERRSAQVPRNSDLVPDKTFKRYKAAKIQRSVPYKTFSRNDCGKISPAIPILRRPFHSADGLHRHRSLAVLYPCQCYSLALFRNSILAPKGFRMHRESGIELEGLSLFVKDSVKRLRMVLNSCHWPVGVFYGTCEIMVM